MPKVSKLTDKRKTSIRKFLKEFTIEDFKNICCIANENAFLTGNNNRNWKADFDFIMRVDKATSILEGKYATLGNAKGGMNDFKKLWEEANIEDEQKGNDTNNNSFGW